MTYIPRREITARIPNKFEAIRVLALECRRLNDMMRAREETTDRKISSMAVERLFSDQVDYYDARERREQERSEEMLSAAEDMFETATEMVVDEPAADAAEEPVEAAAEESAEAAVKEPATDAEADAKQEEEE